MHYICITKFCLFNGCTVVYMEVLNKSKNIFCNASPRKKIDDENKHRNWWLQRVMRESKLINSDISERVERLRTMLNDWLKWPNLKEKHKRLHNKQKHIEALDETLKNKDKFCIRLCKRGNQVVAVFQRQYS